MVIDEINIQGSFYFELAAIEVWLELVEALKLSAKTADKYRVTSNFQFFSMSLDEVTSFLHEQAERGFFIEWEDNSNIKQRFVYLNQGKKQKISCVFDENTLENPNVFCDYLIRHLPIGNLVITSWSFTKSMPMKLRANNNNLYDNPAYKNLRGPYLEGVSAEMWLSENFWEHVPGRKEDLLLLDGVECIQEDNHLYVKSWDEPFSELSGEQLEIQRKLLKTIFHIDENTVFDNGESKGKVLTQKVLITDEGEVKDLGSITEIKE